MKITIFKFKNFNPLSRNETKHSLHVFVSDMKFKFSQILNLGWDNDIKMLNDSFKHINKSERE